MSVTFSQLLDRMEEAATGIAGDASQSIVVDSEVTAETIYPHVVRAVFRDYARMGRHLDDMQMDHAIEIVDGVGTLPDNVIRETLDNAYIIEDQFASRVPYEDFGRYRYDNQMCYFAVRGGNLHYSCDLSEAVRTVVCDGIAGVYGSTALHFTTLAAFTTADEGRRITILDSDGNYILDAFIYSVARYGLLRVVTITVSGSFSTTAVSDGPFSAVISEANFIAVRTITGVSGNKAAATITAASGTFVAADVGRRIRMGTPTNILVTACGEVGARDTYEFSRYHDGAIDYTSGDYHVLYEIDTWELTDETFAEMYGDQSSAEFPWQVKTSTHDWASAGPSAGSLPVPVVGWSYVDVIIDAVDAGGASATIRGYLPGTLTSVSAEILASGVTVNTPGIPTAPTTGSTVLTFSPAIMDDIVMKGASVLRGTTSLESLIESEHGRK